MTRYIQGSALPNLEITWTDTDGDIIDFSTGWTFTLKIGTIRQPALLTVTTGITGASTAPNVTVAWAVGALGVLTPGTWTGQLEAVRTSDNKPRRMQFVFDVGAAVT